MRPASSSVVGILLALVCASWGCEGGAKRKPEDTVPASLGPRSADPEPESAARAPNERATADTQLLIDAGDLPPVVRVDLPAMLAIDDVARAAVAAKKIPGCVVIIGDADGPLYRRAYGARAIVPKRAPMELDTIFDIASLTKVIVTTTAIGILAGDGKVDLSAPVARYLPAFAANGKARITVRQLLQHTGGLPSVNPRSDYEGGYDRALANIYRLRPTHPPGSRFLYTDLGFIVLGELVQRVSGESLDDLAAQKIFGPLGMHETRFRPPAELKDRIAPTEITEHRPVPLIHGEVHDPRAYRLGGVAGNAGVFSTADDLTRFARMVLNGGQLDGQRILKEEILKKLLTPVTLPNSGRRGLGWDIESGYSRHRPLNASGATFGHGGFTGVSLWVDPERKAFVLFLSNRVHPEGEGDAISVAREIGTVAFAALDRPLPYVPRASSKPVLTGIDAIRVRDFAELDGKRVGLLTNVSGRARDGVTTAELLARTPTVELVRLFTPEHGLTGRSEGRISDSSDPATGLPVVSVFGKTRSPPLASLADLDALVFDVQDVGVRFYTYMSTMRAAMEAAANAKIAFIVLDRPNPQGGDRVLGPLLDPAMESFVNHHPLPVLHGMTAGELAKLFREERSIDVELSVVPMIGWRRSMRFEETGLPWFAPSPNLKAPSTAYLYPAVGLVEATNVSVGRGTESAFELLGAPWLDSARFVRALNESGVEGLAIEATSFVPSQRPYRREPCKGARFRILVQDDFEPVRAGLAIMRALQSVAPQKWDRARLGRLLAAPEIERALDGGASLDSMVALYADDEREFRRRREPFLLYR